MLRIRAVELSQLDRTHVDAALTAFDRVDRAEWKDLATARQALVKGLLPFLDRLEAEVGP